MTFGKSACAHKKIVHLSSKPYWDNLSISFFSHVKYNYLLGKKTQFYFNKVMWSNSNDYTKLRSFFVRYFSHEN